MTPEQINEGLKLLELATQEDWHAEEEELYILHIKGGFRRIASVYLDDAPVHDYNAEQRANAALIVYLKNNAPALLAAAQRVQEEVTITYTDGTTRTVPALTAAKVMGKVIEDFKRRVQELESKVEQAEESREDWREIAESHLERVQELEAQNQALREAAEDFVAKVESGRARSTDSYNKFKVALAGKGGE